MTKEQNALDAIKNIELTHMTYDSDENYEGEWEYEAIEVDDGTVADNYPAEIKILEDAVKVLDIIRRKANLFFVDDKGNPNTSEEERKLINEVLFK